MDDDSGNDQNSIDAPDDEGFEAGGFEDEAPDQQEGLVQRNSNWVFPDLVRVQTSSDTGNIQNSNGHNNSSRFALNPPDVSLSTQQSSAAAASLSEPSPGPSTSSSCSSGMSTVDLCASVSNGRSSVPCHSVLPEATVRAPSATTFKLRAPSSKAPAPSSSSSSAAAATSSCLSSSKRELTNEIALLRAEKECLIAQIARKNDDIDQFQRTISNMQINSHQTDIERLVQSFESLTTNVQSSLISLDQRMSSLETFVRATTKHRTLGPNAQVVENEVHSPLQAFGSSHQNSQDGSPFCCIDSQALVQSLMETQKRLHAQERRETLRMISNVLSSAQEALDSYMEDREGDDGGLASSEHKQNGHL